MEPIKKQEPQGNHQEISTIRNESHGTVEYIIQVGAFRNESLAIAAQKRISQVLHRNVEIAHEGQFYKVQIPSFAGIKEAKDFLPETFSEGFAQAFIMKRTKK